MTFGFVLAKRRPAPQKEVLGRSICYPSTKGCAWTNRHRGSGYLLFLALHLFVDRRAGLQSHPKVTEPLRGHDLIAPAVPEPFPPHLWRLCTFTLDESRYVIRCTHWICRVKVQVFVTQQLTRRVKPSSPGSLKWWRTRVWISCSSSRIAHGNCCLFCSATFPVVVLLDVRRFGENLPGSKVKKYGCVLNTRSVGVEKRKQQINTNVSRSR